MSGWTGYKLLTGSISLRLDRCAFTYRTFRLLQRVLLYLLRIFRAPAVDMGTSGLNNLGLNLRLKVFLILRFTGRIQRIRPKGSRIKLDKKTTGHTAFNLTMFGSNA